MTEYLDQEDIADQMDLNEEIQENTEDQQWDDSNIPIGKKSDSLYSLFQKVWRSPNSSKIANLNRVELGDINIAVRDCQYLALLGGFMRHKKFASFFMSQGEITLATSASKKGWFTELFVSRKKFTERAAQSKLVSGGGARWGVFNREKTPPEKDQ